MGKSDSRAEEALRQQSRMEGDRSVWESHWTEVAERVLPRQRDFKGRRAGGEKQSEKIFNVTVQVADGTYTGGLTATRVPVGNGTVTIQGNLTTWSNVAINTTATDCFRFPTAMAATVLIQGFKLTTTTSGRCIIVVAPVQVQFNKIEFGACATQHLNATNAGSMLSAASGASYTISSNVTTHVSAQRAGQVALSGATITFSGSLTLSNFLVGSDAGMIIATAMSWVGTFTGGRAAANSSSLIDNGGANNIPGTTGPVTATGGQYV